MPVLSLDRRSLSKSLAPWEARQRVVSVPVRARFLPADDVLFELWHAGRPWGAVLRTEPVGSRHRRLLMCPELSAGLRWGPGARVTLRQGDDGRIEVSGDIAA